DLRRHVDVDRLPLRVDHDSVAVLEHRDRPADGRLRRHVTDDETVAAARESSVRDQRDLVAEPAADDRARWAQHLAHAGPASRSLVTDHDDVAREDRTSEDRLNGLFLGAEAARSPFETDALLAGDLRDRAFGRE